MTEFDRLFFSDCNIGDFVIDKNQIVISVKNVGVLLSKSESRLKEMSWVKSARIFFYNVSSSKRIIHEYIVNSKVNRFKPAYTVQDTILESTSTHLKQFYFEGLLQKPEAWVEWTISSESFNFEEDNL